MNNKFLITDGAKATNAQNLLESDDPRIWTYFSGQPQADDVKLYAQVAAAYRAYNLKANTVANMPFALVKGNEDFDTSDKWENKVGFMPNPSELFRLGVLSYMATNSIYNLRTSDVLGYKTKGLYHAVAYNFKPVTDPITGELLRIKRGNEVYKPDDPRLVRMWRLDHTTEVLPSENTEAKAIMKAAGEIYFADTWVENFYRRGGIKPTLVAMKGMVSPEKREDEESKWTQWLRGIGKWWTNIARVYNAEALEVKAFGDGVADLQNNEVYRQAIENIALGVGMPLSLMLANSANYSTAKEEKATWYDSDIIPFCNWMAYEYNRQVFEPIGLRFEFRPETIDTQQEDETERASAISAYFDAMLKCPTYEVWKGVMVMYGFEVPDELDTAAKTFYKEKEQRAQEAQDKFNNAPNSDPFEQQRPQRGPVRQQKPPEPQKAIWTPTLDELEELKVWRKATLQRFKRGESLEFEYLPHYGGLPDDVTESICEQLAEEREWSDKDIKAIFDAKNFEVQPKNDIIVLADAINNWANKAFQPST